MKHGTVFRVTLGLGMIVIASILVSYAHDSGPAKTAPVRKPAAVKAHIKIRQDSSVITLPAKPPWDWAGSVTLSPNGRWLAVAVGNYLVLVRDMKTNRWIRTLRGGMYPPLRWHPSKPVFIAAGGSAEKPAFYTGSVSSGKVRQLFRGDAEPSAWTKTGMLYGRWGIVDFAKSGYHGVTTNKFGYRIPWDFGLKAGVQYMSSGPNDQVAAEVQSWDPNKREPTQWIEIYRKVPGRKQWVRSGKIESGVMKHVGAWYPRQPNWLDDGRLVYLRISDRAELWVSNANGSGQRKITTLQNLKPFEEKPSSDWITIDRQGKNVYYLNGKSIRHMHIAIATNRNHANTGSGD